MTDAAPLPKDNMGQPIPRIDARLKVTGQARYPSDFKLSNLAYGVLVTSSIARGTVKSVDLSKARAVPGVLDIVSYDEAKGQLQKPQFSGGAASSIGPLFEPRIWYDGQIVALVVADSFEDATEAASLVTVDYDGERPSASFDSPGVETVDAAGVSPQFKEDPKVGDFDAAFASAPVSIDASYSTPTQHHNPMELFSTTAVWQDGGLTVYEPSQNVHGWKNQLAKELGIAPEKVRIISPFVGGAFGSKGSMTARTAIVALAAMRVGRPVRCVVTRMQSFTVQTYRAETRHHIRIGATADGKITAFSHEGAEITSRPDPYVVAGTETTARMYGYGAVATKVRMVKADRNTPSYMRSPPETPYVYALENAMDEMAVALKMDPVAFRRVNDTMKEPINGAAFSSRSLMQCYDEAAQAFGWSSREAAVGSMRDGDWLVGMGCATAIYPTNVAACTARLRLSADGKLTIQTASHEIGTGVRTVAAQMASERLGIGMDAISVEMGDSSLPPAPVSGGSNSTASVCSTVLKGCEAIRAKLFRAAAAINDGALAGKPASELDLKGGKIVGKDGASVEWKDAFKALGTGQIEEYVEFVPEGGKPDGAAMLYEGKTSMLSGTEGKTVRFAFGAEFVEVRINAYTREIRVPRIVGAFAAGRIMNPRTARSQLMGGMIWGISTALFEETEIDPRSARVVNRDIAEYLMPVNGDIRQLEVILVPEHDTVVNPAGVKGLGELGNVGTPAAISSAVFHATGRRIRDLPIRLDRLL